MELQSVKENKIHLIVIILGIIFILLGAFHYNIWFDEAYSVNIVNHSFKEIWQIGSSDVHPILYYFLLKMISLIFGKNIIAYRLFSCLGIITLGILGYTHIKKDFGNKVGIIFSFLVFFLPVTAIYSSEIRMYSWTITFVTLMFIYMYRIIKNSNIKNYILFMIFSLASAYMHYYGLIIAFFINLFLFIYLIIKKANLKYFIISAIIQIMLYLPWLTIFLSQTKQVSKGFWITLKFPQILLEVLTFQFLGNNDFNLSIIIAIVVYSFIIYSLFKRKEKLPLLSFILYLLVIVTSLIISLKMPILIPRYLFVTTGLLIFTIAYLLSKSSIYVVTFICLLILVFSTYSNIIFIKNNYDNSNRKQIEYIKENIKDNDIIIYTNAIYGSIFNQELNNKQYFYDIENWNVDKPYEAFKPNMTIIKDLSILDNYNGNIWVIDSDDNKLYNIVADEYELVDEKSFKTKYHNLNYNIHLLRK